MKHMNISSSCSMTQMMEELFNRFHNIVMEMEGSVVVLFTLQEVFHSIKYESVFFQSMVRNVDGLRLFSSRIPFMRKLNHL